MINTQIAEILFNMASYIEMESGKNAFFRARALKNASDVLSSFPYDLSSPEWCDASKLEKIQGIGKNTAEHIIEFIKTGKVSDYEALKSKSPVKLEELLRIQGIGPKSILKLYKELGVTDVPSLKKAAQENKISALVGFGDKKQSSILESIEFAITHSGRVSIADAEYEINKLFDFMKNDKNIIKIEVAGSLRRRKETIGDIDILVSSKSPGETMTHFVSYKNVEKVLANGETKSSIWLKSKIQVDIRLVDVDSFGAALQYFTGSKEHNVRLRNVAISKGYKLSEYGLFNRNDLKLKEGKDEKKIYEILVKNYIPPELREDQGEIDVAIKGNLPNLIKMSDIKGDLQMHTTFSDGENSIIDMTKKGIELGYEYIGITDHFGKLKIAGAIGESEFDEYLKSIRKADNLISDIKIYASGEIEISKDGELEFDNGLLKKLDYVIASVHFATKMSKDDMTKRIVKALRNPLTKILAHPTGRLIDQRPGFEFDTNEVFKVAREENVALEINAHPKRLDLNDKLTRIAIEMGCKVIINTDSHSISEMDNMKFGIDVARRGWVQKSDLLKINF